MSKNGLRKLTYASSCRATKSLSFVVLTLLVVSLTRRICLHGVSRCSAKGRRFFIRRPSILKSNQLPTIMSTAGALAHGPHVFKLEIADGSFARASSTKALRVSASLVTVPGNLEDMQLKPVHLRRTTTPTDLKPDDLLPTHDQRTSILHQAIIITVKNLIDNHPKFQRYADEPLLQSKPRRPLPEKYRAQIIAVNESVGEKKPAVLMRGVYASQLGMDDKFFADRAIPSINSAAVNQAIRSAQSAALKRADSNPVLSLQVGAYRFGGSEVLIHCPAKLGPGLLEIHRAMVSAILTSRRGTSRDPGSLESLFKVIKQSPLLSGKPQDFPAILSALDVVLQGNLLGCWGKHCGHGSLDDFADTNPTPQKLLDVAKNIVIKHAKFEDDLEDSSGLSKESESVSQDTVHENNRILVGDLLYLAMLKSAINDGDFGRVEDMLGDLFSYLVGGGMDEVAEGIFYFIWDVKYRWTEAFAYAYPSSMYGLLTHNFSLGTSCGTA